MKNELINLCHDLEDHFDKTLVNLDGRLGRLDSEMSERIKALKQKYADDTDVEELEQLSIGLRRTTKLLRGKLGAIMKDGDHLLGELHNELKEKMPAVRKKLEESENLDQAMIEIQRETHSGSGGLGDFFKGLFMWQETPEEHLESQKKD